MNISIPVEELGKHTSWNAAMELAKAVVEEYRPDNPQEGIVQFAQELLDYATKKEYTIQEIP